MSLLGGDFDDAMRRIRDAAVRLDQVLYELNLLIVKVTALIPSVSLNETLSKSTQQQEKKS